MMNNLSSIFCMPWSPVCRAPFCRWFVLFFLFIPLDAAWACKCSEHPPISKEQFTVYDVIFEGKVDSVSVCKEGFSTAYFTLSSLFKGESFPQNEVRFDCTSDCQMSFSKGEEWIVYAQYFKYGKLELNFCSRSRKKIVAGDDYFEALNRMSYSDEQAFLVKTLGTKKVLGKKNETMPERVLIQPTDYWKLWCLLISLVCMYVIFYLVKKMP